MSAANNEQAIKKTRLHPRNKHQERYDFAALTKTLPDLAPFAVKNKYGDETIDFFNPDAVRTLNKALLMNQYGITYWEIPTHYLCPPIPGRADYIHHMADVLCASNYGKIPTGNRITCLDIGVGANCIYPIIGVHEYGWSFIGSEIDKNAIASAEKICAKNSNLTGRVDLRLQKNPSDTFASILADGERVDLSICNPPFHRSHEEAREGTLRKLNNLRDDKVSKAELNFGGKHSELCTKGGEKQFIVNMIHQSKRVAKSCFWFSTLVSKQSNLQAIYDALAKVDVEEYNTIPMGTGNKTSRIVVWSFLDQKERIQWAKERWGNE